MASTKQARLGGSVLIGKIMRNGNKERVLVTTEEHKGVKVIDLRAYQIINDGELVPTQEGIFLQPETIETLITLLRDAQKKVSA
jgi:hypothetical protein